MVLFIIALSLGGIFGTATTLIRQSEDRDTKDRVILAKERIQGFASSNQRLPVYATGAGADELTSVLPNWRDFWAQKLVYIYDPELAKSTTGLASTLCAKKTTAIQIKNCPDATCATFSIQTNVAYIVFSTGRNMVNQTGAAAAPHTEASPDPSYSGPDGAAGVANLKTITMYPHGTRIGSYATPTTDPQENDDVFAIVTLDELRNKLSCQGTPLRIVNSDLPTGAQSTTYNISIYADGGIPVSGTAGKYRWCAETTLTPGTVSAIVTLEGIGSATSSVTLGVAGSCAAAVENTWIVGDTLRIRGAGASNALATTTAGTYDITVYVRDDQNADALVATTTDPLDNITFRKFVLGISGP